MEREVREYIPFLPKSIKFNDYGIQIGNFITRIERREIQRSIENIANELSYTSETDVEERIQQETKPVKVIVDSIPNPWSFAIQFKEELFNIYNKHIKDDDLDDNQRNILNSWRYAISLIPLRNIIFGLIKENRPKPYYVERFNIGSMAELAPKWLKKGFILTLTIDENIKSNRVIIFSPYTFVFVTPYSFLKFSNCEEELKNLLLNPIRRDTIIEYLERLKTILREDRLKGIYMKEFEISENQYTDLSSKLLGLLDNFKDDIIHNSYGLPSSSSKSYKKEEFPIDFESETELPNDSLGTIIKEICVKVENPEVEPVSDTKIGKKDEKIYIFLSKDEESKSLIGLDFFNINERDKIERYIMNFNKPVEIIQEDDIFLNNLLYFKLPYKLNKNKIILIEKALNESESIYFGLPLSRKILNIFQYSKQQSQPYYDEEGLQKFFEMESNEYENVYLEFFGPTPNYRHKEKFKVIINLGGKNSIKIEKEINDFKEHCINSFAIFPDFLLLNDSNKNIWKKYFCFLNISTPKTKIYFEEPYEPEYERENIKIYAVNKPIKYISFEDNEGYQGQILFSYERIKKEEGKEVRLGIDFGTVNTNMSYWDKSLETTKPTLLDFDFNNIIISSYGDVNESFWLDFCPNAKKSMPVFTRILEHRLKNDNESNVFSEGTIPFDAIHKNIIENLKFGISQRQDKGARIFIKQILLYSIAFLVKEKVSKVKVRYSYPLAFSQSFRNRIEGIYEEAIRFLRDISGISIEFDEERKFSESFSVTQFALEKEKDRGMRKSTPRLILDIGGGTTNIAFGYYKDEEFVMPINASFKLGGKDIITETIKRVNNSDLNKFLGINELNDINIENALNSITIDKYKNFFLRLTLDQRFLKKICSAIHYYINGLFYYLVFALKDFDKNDLISLKLIITGKGSLSMLWAYIFDKDLLKFHIKKWFKEVLGLENFTEEDIIIYSFEDNYKKEEVGVGMLISDKGYDAEKRLLLGEDVILKNGELCKSTDDISRLNDAKISQIDHSNFKEYVNYVNKFLKLSDEEMLKSMVEAIKLNENDFVNISNTVLTTVRDYFLNDATNIKTLLPPLFILEVKEMVERYLAGRVSNR